MITVQEINGQTRKLGLAYEKVLGPLCKETGLPHTALSILLFIANNPEFATASDVCEMRGLKRSLVSAHVERLVSEGYVERRAVPGDRRKDALVYTQKAEPIVCAGQELQHRFAECLLSGLDQEKLTLLGACFSVMGANIERILKEEF